MCGRFRASVVRTTVYWSRTAPRRPARPANPFDFAYRFADLDEFVRSAATRGIAVMLTIWGTPSWANGGKGENVAPTRVRSGTRRPVVKVPAFEFVARGGPGAKVYSTVKAYLGGRLVRASQPPPVAIGPSGYVSIRTPIPRVVKNNQYVVSLELSDANGYRVYRYVSLGGA